MSTTLIVVSTKALYIVRLYYQSIKTNMYFIGKKSLKNVVSFSGADLNLRPLDELYHVTYSHKICIFILEVKFCDHSLMFPWSSGSVLCSYS